MGRFVLDTDLGTDVDDVLALTLLAAVPGATIAGVTTVDGDTTVRAGLARHYLDLTGHEKVPVVAGACHSLGPGRMPSWNGWEGAAVDRRTTARPRTALRHDEDTAARWLVEEAAVEPYHLICIGPLTNVARAVRLDPAFAGRLAGVTIMGGLLRPESVPPEWADLIRRSGRSVHALDHNTASDVEAAAIVGAAVERPTWVPIEVTLNLALDEEALDRLRRTGTALTGALHDELTLFRRRVLPGYTGTYTGRSPVAPDTVAYLHDVLAVLSATGVAPGAYDTDELTVAYERQVIAGEELFTTTADPSGRPARFVTRARPDGVVSAWHEMISVVADGRRVPRRP